ncbi:MAG: NAD(+) synthase [Lachnospiraceae bacterium]|nr:NAD(+) synthase [Lachnospiraceae bacterium]
MFDPKTETKKIIGDIKEWFDRNAPGKTAVLGISGGKDSTVAAALLKEALGKDHVMGVMMPNGVQKDIGDSELVIQTLGINSLNINICGAYSAMLDSLESSSELKATPDAEVNLQPRLRMAVLYMVAQTIPEGGIVINTCNRSEDYVGWATKFGDCAGDMSVLGNYLVSEIIAMGDALGLPKNLVHKAPADGLWGDTDEDRMGFTYAEEEAYIKTGTSGRAEADAKIERMHRTSRHKYEPMFFCGECS